MKHLIATVFILTFLLACKNEAPKQEETKSVKTQNNLIVEKVEGCESKDAPCKRLRITYPDIQKYEDDLRPVIDDYMRVYISDFLITDKPLQADNFQDFIDQSADAIIADRSESNSQYDFFFDFKEIYKNQALLCFENIYKVIDGTENESGTGYIIFDQNENEILQIPQIIENENAIRLMLLEKLKNLIGIAEDIDLETADFYISDQDFAVTNNIGITENEMIFTYLPLEIAPKNRGLLSFRIPKDDISPHLTGDFVKKWANQ